jgi:hypothetical protein
MTADLHLLHIALPQVRRSFKRKSRENQVAGVVWTCRTCGWRSEPCQTMAATKRPPHHECAGKNWALVVPSASARRAGA